MVQRIIGVLGLCLLLVSLSVHAAEIIVPLSAGKPSQQEFEVAAKRALYSRNYAIWSIDPGVVIGKYKNRVEIALVLGEKRVLIRVVDSGGVQSDTLFKYLRNLERDFTYEIASYALAPTTTTDPAKIAALLASANPAPGAETEAQSNTLVWGTYQSRITTSTKWVFGKTEYRNLVVDLKQDGNKITGFNKSLGMKIEGTIEGNEINFFTWPSSMSNSEFKGTWTVSDDGQTLTGRWWYHHGQGDWNLEKIN